MSYRLQTSLGRGLAALVVTLALTAPAAADHWRGYPGMGHGHPACQGYPGHHPGMADCPHARGPAEVPPMAGKALGVYISDLPNAMLDAANVGYGVNVEKVQADSPAAAAGIQAGDLITEFAGKPVLSGDRLRWLVRKAESGKSLDVKLMREGKPATVSVTLPAPASKGKCDPAGAPRLGT
jgi:membrane-associated protease RseP (regulator of RpoE activity)